MGKFLLLISSCFILSVLFLVVVDKNASLSKQIPKPEEGEENDKKREKWYELIHRAAPGVDWHGIEAQNQGNAQSVRANYMAQKFMVLQDESFANGDLQGYWDEKGSDNQAGRNIEAEYDAVNNNFYAISSNGTLWKKNVSSGNWIELNKDLRFNRGILKVFKDGNGTSHLILSGNGRIVYSVNEGQTFYQAAGIANPLSIAMLTDAARSIYCLNYDGLYLSTDLGQNFTRIFAINSDGRTVSLCKPHNSNQLYLLDNRTPSGPLKLFAVSGSAVRLLHTASITETNIHTQLRGITIGTTTTLYALLGDAKLYRSIDEGAGWTLQSTLPAGSGAFEVSTDDPQLVYIGGVEAYRSGNGGISWTLVNSWGEYYGNPAVKLHADIMTITAFRKADGSPVVFINCDGGTFVSNDNLQTVANIGLTSLRNSQYYDVTTDPDQPSRLYAGSQDQGLQINTTATRPGVLNFTQVRSGDYGYLTLSGVPRHLWTQYPGGLVDYYNDPLGGINASFAMKGSQKPNYGWMMPIANVANKTRNEVLMGGGNLTGGGGSYLVRLSAATNAPYTINASQFNYDFRANSNSGSVGITAIEACYTDTNRIYVAMEDGSFFYTNNGGNTWNKATSFAGPGPWYLYGSSIYSSRLTPNLVWFAGSGYSNPPVYVSSNGGQTFTPASNGLPPTLVYQIVANPTETMLFAATEAGPYVYIMAKNQWFPMLGANNPLQTYDCVEYIDATNTVRFGTYARGIWDFVVTNAAPSTPSITYSGSVNLCQGNSLLLTSSSSNGNQWYLNGVAISGATGSTYTAGQSGSYTVRVTGNNLTSNHSTAVVISVNPIPGASVVTASGLTTFCDGGNTVLTSSFVTGNQWQKDGTAIAGATDKTYKVTQGGVYTVKVTSSLGCTSPASAPVAVTVNVVPAAPTITASGPTDFCQGNNVLLTSSVATGNQWYQDGAVIMGEHSSMLRVDRPGTYSVIITVNGCTSPASSQAITVKPMPPQPIITQTNGILQSSAPAGNQWFINGMLIPMATGNSYKPSIPGQYSVQVTTTGCTGLASAGYVFGGSTNTFIDQIMVAPNPVQNTLYIISSNTTDKLSVQMFAMDGRLMAQGEFIARYDLNMDNMAAGYYFVQIVNERTNEKYRRTIMKR